MDTQFRIAALSQTFTAAAILALEADGQLSINDPVFRYLPEFEAKPYRDITIHHLLTHSSGLPPLPADKKRIERLSEMSQAPTPVMDYVRLACECPLKFPPGRRALYSNFNYRVLSAVVVVLMNDNFADFMQEAVFDRLGLRQTGVARIAPVSNETTVAESDSEVIPAEAEATIAEAVSMWTLEYRRPEHSWLKTRFLSTDRLQNYGAKYGNAGIYTSTTDLLRWDRILAGDEFLPAEQKTKMFQPFRNNYACGWDRRQGPGRP